MTPEELAAMLTPTIGYPEATVYVVFLPKGGTPQTVAVTPDLCFYLGVGATILWQGTDEAEWRAECEKLGVGAAEQADTATTKKGKP
jgi:hypothetical protein